LGGGGVLLFPGFIPPFGGIFSLEISVGVGILLLIGILTGLMVFPGILIILSSASFLISSTYHLSPKHLNLK
jgi:hypothetical protein